MPGLIQPERQVAIDMDKDAIVAVKVKSLSSGQWNTLELRETPIPIEDWKAWQQGIHIQDAMSYLTPDEREFLLTGMTPEEWGKAFPEED